jgi:hypothetical protein
MNTFRRIDRVVIGIPGRELEQGDHHLFSLAPDPEAREIKLVTAGFLTFPSSGSLPGGNLPVQWL